jgi:glutamate-1-semialdehyde 2,1-aminomutase
MSSTITTSSAELLEDAARVIPGGINTCKRKISPPLCIRRASGAYLEDMEGRRYVDYHAAYGAIFLGHSHPAVSDHVNDVMREVVLFGVGVTEIELAVAQKVVEHVPSVDQVLACNSGSEATLHAIRLARAVTGRQKLLKFQGGYNGFHDYVLMNILSEPDRLGTKDPHSAGMLREAVEDTIVCRFNDLDDVARAFRENPEQVAAIIVEPIPHTAPSILPRPGFLEGLRRMCDTEGALLILDEVVTGFRHHIGGYQAIAGLSPDLTTMGKAIANGFPVALVGGRRHHMERFNTTATGDVYFGGTYNGNAIGLAAAQATIAQLEDGSVHRHVFRLGERMRAGLREITARAGVPAVVTGYGSLYALLFMDGPVDSYDDVVRNDTDLVLRYRTELRARGVFEMPENYGRNHISASHTDDDIDRSLTAAEEALRAALDAGAAHRAL